MPYLYDLPNSTAGMDSILVQTMNISPYLSPMLLLFVFFTVFLGGMARQKLRTGIADAPVWAVIASMSMFLIALIMTMITGLIGLDTLVIVIVLTIFSAVWLFLDKRSSEV